MNKHYIRDWDDGMPYVPHTEAHQRASWGLIVVALLFAFCAWLFAPSARAQTVPTFTATVTKGISPVSTAFTWACPAGTVSASAASTGNQAAWIGAKALSGTQNLSGIKLTADYRIDCVGSPGTGTATLNWTAPTQNTDGSALTNLAGYTVSWGASISTLTNKIDVTDPTKTSLVIDKLAAGPTWFGVQANSSAGVSSALSNIANKTITVSAAPIYSATVTITVQTQPAPPVLSTVDTTAYTINKATDALSLAAVGSVPLGVACKPQYDANGLNVVPRSSVTFKTSTKPLVVVAKCG
jgi:hypothetical protein